MQISVTFPDNNTTKESLRVDKQIGQGKFSVFQAYSASRKTNYALKVFPANRVSTYLFNKEQHFSMFSHPNLIKQFPAISNHADFHIILTELAKFGDFFEVLESGLFANNEVLIRTYFHQLVEGIQHMHSQGVAHLDLKLENLMLGSDFQLKIIDFDSSELISDANISSKGTVNYRAPELISGTGKNATAADIYSMGMILYALKASEFIYVEQHQEEEGAMSSFLQFHNNKEAFWSEKAESLRGSVTFSEEFIELLNGMLSYDAEKRMTLEEIKNSAWYKGEVLSAADLKSIMRGRWNEAAKKKEQENEI